MLLPITALAVLACCLSAATASAGELVPPGNSAVNQYTETFPTSEGEEQSSLEKKKGVTPGQVLGAGKAHQLEDKGAAGKAVAQFTAETAPSSASDTGAGESTTNGNGSGNGKGKTPQKQGGNGPNGGGEEEEGSGGAGGGAANTGSGGSSGSSGSSGFGEIASQATGTSSGSVGLWLPLILIAVVAWSAVYVWRNRQQRVV